MVVWLVWGNVFRLDGYLYWRLLGVLCFDLRIAVMLVFVLGVDLLCLKLACLLWCCLLGISWWAGGFATSGLFIVCCLLCCLV